MLELSHVSKRFENKEILRDFSYAFPEGECACMFGPSGSGKTTFLRIAAGLLPQDAGIIRRSDFRTSFLFQEDRLLPWYSAIENLTAVGVSRSAAQKALDSVGLSGESSTLPKDLSGGMQRRLAIARMLSFGGDLFFLDEPLRGLDEVTAEPVLMALKETIRGKTALLITHDPDEAFYLSDHVLVLSGPPLAIQKRAKTAELGSANALKRWLSCELQ